MHSFRLASLSLLIAASFGMHNALALTIDQVGTDKTGAANLGDPDDKIPFPHVADDGTPPVNNFQAQPMGNTGVSFGLAPTNPQPDAFERAKERMQQ